MDSDAVPAAVTMRLPRTTALTCSGRCSRARSKVVSASRQTRTVPSSPPVTMTAAPSGNRPAATAFTGPVGPRSGSPPGAVSQPRDPHGAVVAVGDDDWGAIRQPSDGRCADPAVPAIAQQFPIRSAVTQSPQPDCAVVAGNTNHGATWRPTPRWRKNVRCRPGLSPSSPRGYGRLSAVPSAGHHDVRVTAPSRSRRSCLRSRPPSSAETMSSQPSGEGRCRTERPGSSPRRRPCPPAPELKICVRSPARPTRCRMPTVGGIVHRYLPVSPRLAPGTMRDDAVNVKSGRDRP